MALTPEEYLLQSKVVNEGVDINSDLRSSGDPNLHSKLNTTEKKSIIKSVNELVSSKNAVASTVNNTLNQSIDIVGDWVSDPTLKTEMDLIGDNVIDSILKLNTSIDRINTITRETFDEFILPLIRNNVKIADTPIENEAIINNNEFVFKSDDGKIHKAVGGKHDYKDNMLNSTLYAYHRLFSNYVYIFRIDDSDPDTVIVKSLNANFVKRIGYTIGNPVYDSILNISFFEGKIYVIGCMVGDGVDNGVVKDIYSYITDINNDENNWVTSPSSVYVNVNSGGVYNVAKVINDVEYRYYTNHVEFCKKGDEISFIVGDRLNGALYTFAPTNSFSRINWPQVTSDFIENVNKEIRPYNNSLFDINTGKILVDLSSYAGREFYYHDDWGPDNKKVILILSSNMNTSDRLLFVNTGEIIELNFKIGKNIFWYKRDKTNNTIYIVATINEILNICCISDVEDTPVITAYPLEKSENYSLYNNFLYNDKLYLSFFSKNNELDENQKPNKYGYIFDFATGNYLLNSDYESFALEHTDTINDSTGKDYDNISDYDGELVSISCCLFKGNIKPKISEVQKPDTVQLSPPRSVKTIETSETEINYYRDDDTLIEPEYHKEILSRVGLPEDYILEDVYEKLYIFKQGIYKHVIYIDSLNGPVTLLSGTDIRIFRNHGNKCIIFYHNGDLYVTSNYHMSNPYYYNYDERTLLKISNFPLNPTEIMSVYLEIFNEDDDDCYISVIRKSGNTRYFIRLSIVNSVISPTIDFSYSFNKSMIDVYLLKDTKTVYSVWNDKYIGRVFHDESDESTTLNENYLSFVDGSAKVSSHNAIHPNYEATSDVAFIVHINSNHHNTALVFSAKGYTTNPGMGDNVYDSRWSLIGFIDDIRSPNTTKLLTDFIDERPDIYGTPPPPKLMSKTVVSENNYDSLYTVISRNGRSSNKKTYLLKVNSTDHWEFPVSCSYTVVYDWYKKDSITDNPNFKTMTCFQGICFNESFINIKEFDYELYSMTESKINDVVEKILTIKLNFMPEYMSLNVGIDEIKGVIKGNLVSFNLRDFFRSLGTDCHFYAIYRGNKLYSKISKITLINFDFDFKVLSVTDKITVVSPILCGNNSDLNYTDAANSSLKILHIPEQNDIHKYNLNVISNGEENEIIPLNLIGPNLYFRYPKGKIRPYKLIELAMSNNVSFDIETSYNGIYSFIITLPSETLDLFHPFVREKLSFDVIVVNSIDPDNIQMDSRRCIEIKDETVVPNTRKYRADSKIPFENDPYVKLYLKPVVSNCSIIVGNDDYNKCKVLEIYRPLSDITITSLYVNKQSGGIFYIQFKSNLAKYELTDLGIDFFVKVNNTEYKCRKDLYDQQYNTFYLNCDIPNNLGPETVNYDIIVKRGEDSVLLGSYVHDDTIELPNVDSVEMIPYVEGNRKDIRTINVDVTKRCNIDYHFAVLDKDNNDITPRYYGAPVHARTNYSLSKGINSININFDLHLRAPYKIIFTIDRIESEFEEFVPDTNVWEMVDNMRLPTLSIVNEKWVNDKIFTYNIKIESASLLDTTDTLKIYRSESNDPIYTTNINDIDENDNIILPHLFIKSFSEKIPFGETEIVSIIAGFTPKSKDSFEFTTKPMDYVAPIVGTSTIRNSIISSDGLSFIEEDGSVQLQNININNIISLNSVYYSDDMYYNGLEATNTMIPIGNSVVLIDNSINGDTSMNDTLNLVDDITINSIEIL